MNFLNFAEFPCGVFLRKKEQLCIKHKFQLESVIKIRFVELLTTSWFTLQNINEGQETLWFFCSLKVADSRLIYEK